MQLLEDRNEAVSADTHKGLTAPGTRNLLFRRNGHCLPDQCPDCHGCPRDTGAYSRVRNALRDSNTSTTMVATYGSIASRFEGIARPMPCATRYRILAKPNRYAPSSNRPTRQLANTTNARAIQSRPALMFCAHIGV